MHRIYAYIHLTRISPLHYVTSIFKFILFPADSHIMCLYILLSVHMIDMQLNNTYEKETHLLLKCMG
jgi:hypothetical protein